MCITEEEGLKKSRTGGEEQNGRREQEKMQNRLREQEQEKKRRRGMHINPLSEVLLRKTSPFLTHSLAGIEEEEQ